jgi:murein peptide amidase A
MRRTPAVLFLSLMLALAGLATAPAQALSTGQIRLASHVIGKSVDGRKIVAYHRFHDGETWRRTVVVIGQMHGNETAGRDVARRMLHGPLPRHLDLWVIISVNPDGFAADRRQNAHGVDLNRNFPQNWRHTAKGTANYSGPSAGSEPETQLVMAFLDKVNPHSIVSIHQPLDGIDAYHAKRKAFGVALSKATGLGIKVFACHSSCYGTMTQWFNHNHAGAAITMELPEHPSAKQLRRIATGTDRVLAAGT